MENLQIYFFRSKKKGATAISDSLSKYFCSRLLGTMIWSKLSTQLRHTKFCTNNGRDRFAKHRLIDDEVRNCFPGMSPMLKPLMSAVKKPRMGFHLQSVMKSNFFGQRFFSSLIYSENFFTKP